MVSILHERDAADISAYYQDNAAHLDPWEPLRTPDFHSERSWRIRGRSAQAEHRDDQSLRLIARFKATGSIAAACNFTGIQRGPFNACTLGYSVAQAHQGTGLMFEVASAALNYVFADLGLHRVLAEELGQKTLTDFRGSMLYCSKELADCCLNGPQPVDLYHNDAEALDKTLKSINDL